MMAVRRLRDLSIPTKLTWMNLLASGVALLLASVALMVFDTISFRRTLVRSLSTQAQIVGSNSASALLFNDPASAQSTLAALKAAPSIVSAVIYKPDGKPFAAFQRDRGSELASTLPALTALSETHEFGGNRLRLVHPIVFQGKLIGAVALQSDLREISDRKRLYGMTVVLVVAPSMIAALLVSSISRRSIAQPIERLAETARIVTNEKRYSVRAKPIASHDEVASLIGCFNEMLQEIERRDEELQKGRDELEQRVQQRTAELEATNKELEAFTYSVSHDLRAPLRHIDGFSKLLAESSDAQLTEEAREYIDLIRDSTHTMGQLVDDLLNLARIGRKELSLQATGLDSLVQEVVEEQKREIPQRTIEWKVARLPFVECDPGLMRQVFQNLISNAVKYTRPREHAIIEVGVKDDNGHPAIFIRDNGVGFSMKHADKLFRVFQRLHRQEDFEGTGVGLATVSRIIQKHGGEVWAEAELDRGATFYFTLRPLNERELGRRASKEASNESESTCNSAG